MSAAQLLEGLAGLALVAFVGRVALSLFPPGLPGAHAPRELATTWAASHLCGALALAAEHRALELAGLDLAPLWLVAPWLVVLAVRRVLSPSAMLPRQELRQERPGKTAAVVLGVLAIASFAPWGRQVRAASAPGPGSVSGPEAAAELLLALERNVAFVSGDPAVAAVLYPASFVALVVLLAHGLERARRAPLGRRVVLAVFVLTPVAQRLAAARASSMLVALCAGAGAAFAVAWLRRADRRAAALCAVSFSGAALFEPAAALLGFAALASVWLVTAAPSRGSFARLAAPTWAALALLGGAHVVLGEALGDLDTYRARLGSLVRAALRFETWELRWFALLPALFVAAWALRRSAGEDEPFVRDGVARVGGTGRELAGLLAALTLGLLAQALVPTLDRDAALLPVAAIGALAVGLALVRAERPASILVDLHIQTETESGR